MERLTSSRTLANEFLDRIRGRNGTQQVVGNSSHGAKFTHVKQVVHDGRDEVLEFDRS